MSISMYKCVCVYNYIYIYITMKRAQLLWFGWEILKHCKWLLTRLYPYSNHIYCLLSIKLRSQKRTKTSKLLPSTAPRPNPAAPLGVRKRPRLGLFRQLANFALPCSFLQLQLGSLPSDSFLAQWRPCPGPKMGSAPWSFFLIGILFEFPSFCCFM